MGDLFGGRLLYGAAVYPEVWGVDTFAVDVAHMARLGMNTARLGEFCWSTLEPEQDHFDLGLIHEALGVLQGHGMSAILCTPTATPPVWLTHGHAERLHHTSEGKRLGHGSRQHACTNNPFFRERAGLITAALAENFGTDPRVVAWQLDNEFKSHVAGCHCPTCRGLWAEWLAVNFREVAELNRRWSTSTWSETYQSFDQVPLPGPTPFLHNSSLSSAFARFSQERINQFAQAQAQIIRDYGAAPITHNSGFGFSLDNKGLYDSLDFSSFDTYPAADNYPAFLMNLDYFPQFGNSGNTVLMETSTSHGGSIASYGRPHPAGFVEAEIFANFAAGSRGFLFWPFRQNSGGSEQPHGAVVSPWGAPTIGHSAAAAGGALVKRLAPLLEAGEPVPDTVAITYSDRAKIFMEIESGGGLDYRSALSGLHRTFVESGIRRSLLPEAAPLDGIKVLFTPYVHYLDPGFLDRIGDWVRNGGTWVAGPGTGDRDGDHRWLTSAALGAVEELAGVRGVFQFPATGSGTTAQAWDWTGNLDGMSTFMEPTTAQVLGTVTSGPATGHAFLTENSGTAATGAGRVILVGSLPDASMGSELMEALIEHAVAEVAPRRSRAGANTVVEYQRTNAGKFQRWLVNMSGSAAEFHLQRPATELLSHSNLPAGFHSLAPYEFIIAEEQLT